MALEINDLKRGSRIVIEGDPYIVMFTKHLHMGRGGAVVQTKSRNLRNGKILERNFKSGDGFEEAELKKISAQFIYEKRGEYWFNEIGNPGNRFELKDEVLGDQIQFLKPKMEVSAILFGEQIINIELPIKAEYEVTDAPPNVRGNTAQGGNKQVTIETGARITVPMFIETGDRILINTDTGEYTERA
jgi:elongation factor P